MGFGILEPKSSQGSAGTYIPGTAPLYDKAPHRADAKHDGSDSSLILVPQPTDDPNDPLNWSTWKKEICFLALVYNIAMGAVSAPILANVGGVIVKEFKISFPEFALLNGWPLLATGFSAFFFNAIGQVWGRRPCYLIATSFLVAATIWNSYVRSYGEFVACRVVSGIAAGPYESVIISSIGDLFFVHQRGRRIMFYNIATLGTVLLSLIADGYVGEKYGWRTMFIILFPFTIVGWLLVFFFVPEHTFVREHKADSAVVVSSGRDAEAASEPDEKPAAFNSDQAGSPARPVRPVPAKKSWLQELKPFNGRLTNLNPFIVMGRSLVCIFFPTVMYGILISGVWSAFNGAMAVTLAQTFASKLSPTVLGYISVFPFVGTFIGFALGQVASDPSAKWAARMNKGVFEPEFRMFMVIPALVIGVPAYFGYGNYALEEHPSWTAVSGLWGVFAFGNIFACAAAYNYVLDAHDDIRMDVTVALVFARQIFWWGSTKFMSEWLESAPTNVVYNASGAIMGGCTALTIFFYMFGKYFRKWVHEYSPFQTWGWN